MKTPAARAAAWLESNALILDTETTGLDGDAEVVELAVIDCTGQTLIDTLVRPCRPIPADASGIHGITDQMVAAAPDGQTFAASCSICSPRAGTW